MLLALRRARGGNSRQLQVTVETAELPAVRPPTARRVSSRVSQLELFGVINALGPSASRYVEPAHHAIREAATARPCGWVVDLRRNTGGSLPPMLAAVGPILGDGDGSATAPGTAPSPGSAIGTGWSLPMGDRTGPWPLPGGRRGWGGHGRRWPCSPAGSPAARVSGW
jgi:hypothetical protein